MATLTILAFLIEKCEATQHRLHAMSATHTVHPIIPLTQVKVIYENLPMESHGATAPNLAIRRYERQYLDAAP